VETRRLGGSSIDVSVVGLGCNNFGGRLDFAGTRIVVEAALAAGVTFFDNADVYGERGGSERFLGEILEGRRDRVVLATKFGWDARVGGHGSPGSRCSVRRALEASLERLRTDHVDLYYYHRPDGVTPLAETLEAMYELVDDGRVRAIGCSNLSAEQLREAHAYAVQSGREIAALQNQYSLLERGAETEILPLCLEYRIGFIPYFPLASGLLTGKYQRGRPPPSGSRLENRPDARADERLEQVEALEEFATARGHTLLELAIGSLASRPGVVSVIAGAMTPDQVRANAAAAWRLADHDLNELDAIRRVAA
jgi:aryl-alcohol dehydrogenase-like predicted oxidoreductase